MITPGKTVTSVAVGAYLLCFGMLAGMAVDRMLYDRQRERVLSRYDHAVAEWQQLRMSWEAEEARPAPQATRALTSEP
jgi:hypothetical protein